MPNTIQLPQDLYEAVRQKALAQQKTTEDLVIEWVSAHLDEAEHDDMTQAFEQEVAAFERLKTTLLAQYAGQYVAIYQGQVVGVGEDRLTLVKEVYRRFGEVPCYIEQVSSEPLRRVRITSVWKAQ